MRLFRSKQGQSSAFCSLSCLLERHLPSVGTQHTVSLRLTGNDQECGYAPEREFALARE